MNGQVILRPLLLDLMNGQATGFMSARKAVRIARRMHGYPRQPARALRASLTVPGSIPLRGAHNRVSTIENAPVWIVTFTLPKPVNATMSCPAAARKCPKYMIRHVSFALDAANGRFVTGFETT